jgi:hypothetical protein
MHRYLFLFVDLKGCMTLWVVAGIWLSERREFSNSNLW